MLCAIAYAVVAVGRIPLILFLKYDPKDIIIAIGGLIWGPLTSFLVSLIVSFIEMLTISDTGIFGCIMNVISSCTFACTAALIYKKRRTLAGAVTGLLCGWFLMVATMLLWNYLISPIYMGYPREAVVKLLLPAFLPFNSIKGGLNVSFTILLYKPIVTGLRKSRILPDEASHEKTKINIGLVSAAVFIIITCILLVLALKGLI